MSLKKHHSLFSQIHDVFLQSLVKLFGLTLCFFYGVITGVSLLGFLGIYKPLPGVLLSLIIFVIGYFWFSKNVYSRLYEVIHKTVVNSFQPALDVLMIISGFLVIFLLILLPVIRWPLSYSGDWFVWDAGAYHFPKAIELYRSGSVWDLSIPYGEYPFGYESSLTFAISLSGNEIFFGLVHVFIISFLISSALLIAVIVTNLSSGFLFISIVLMILSDNIFKVFNLWKIFTLDIYTVGKNDLFLCAAQLAFLVFVFIPEENAKGDHDLIGISLASMIALAIKPNTVLLVVPLLLYKIWGFIHTKRMVKGSTSHTKLNIKNGSIILIALILILPGVLWVIRNQVNMGRIFSDEVLQLSQWSILANITNPNFYNYIPKNLILIVGILTWGIIVSSFRRKELRLATLIYFLLLISFLSTPVSGFFKRTDIPAQISWRFAETLLVFVFIYLLAFIEQPIISFTKLINKYQLMQVAFSILIISISSWLIINQADKMQVKPENEIILHDQYRQPVGTRGYRSAYDYVQQNIRNSVIWVENGLPYYVYGPGFTNSITRMKVPDFLIIIHTDWFGEGKVTVPSYMTNSDLKNNYKLLYDDKEGSVYESVK